MRIEDSSSTMFEKQGKSWCTHLTEKQIQTACFFPPEKIKNNFFKWTRSNASIIKFSFLLSHFVFVWQELKDPQCRDEMAAARGALKKNATMLYTASQAFLRHPDVAATRANRDYVFKQVQEAIGGISSAAQATSPTDEKHGHAGIGELAAALNEFDVSTHFWSLMRSQIQA